MLRAVMAAAMSGASVVSLTIRLTRKYLLFHGYLFGKPLPLDKFETALRKEIFRSL